MVFFILETCKDLAQTCTRYVKMGYCKKHVSWMTRNCRKSCNKCSDKKSTTAKPMTTPKPKDHNSKYYIFA